MERNATIFNVQIGKKSFEVDSLSSVLSIATLNEGEIEVVQGGITVFKGDAGLLQAEVENLMESGETKFPSDTVKSIPAPAMDQMQMSSHLIAGRVASRVLCHRKQ